MTASGQLFIWGCGDGGRLGLGEERLGPQYEPVLVESLSTGGERIGTVSCGNSHTLVRTKLVKKIEVVAFAIGVCTVCTVKKCE